MIWFTCQKCNKKHGRPESSVGTLVFCECGQGNAVPWESTTEPEVTVITELLPPAPELAPVKFAVEKSPTLTPPRRPPSLRDEDRPERSRRSSPPRRPRPRDPNFCLYHAAVASEAVCADCKNGLCRDCLVQFQGQPLCAPCKNQRVKALQKPPATSQLALVSLLLALFTGPLAFCLHPLGAKFSFQRLSIWALLPQFVALGLGIWALSMTEKNRRLGGKSLAVSAVITAGFAVFWTIFLTVYGAALMGTAN